MSFAKLICNMPIPWRWDLWWLQLYCWFFSSAFTCLPSLPLFSYMSFSYFHFVHYPFWSRTNGSNMFFFAYRVLLQCFAQIQKGSPQRPFEGEGIDLSFMFDNVDNMIMMITCIIPVPDSLWTYCSSPSVKQVSFYDDDVRFWQHWRNCSAAAEAPTAVNQQSNTFSAPAPSTRGRHFVVICCENKVIFLDLVTMRGRDVPKQELDNRSLLWCDFLSLIRYVYLYTCLFICSWHLGEPNWIMNIGLVFSNMQFWVVDARSKISKPIIWFWCWGFNLHHTSL